MIVSSDIAEYVVAHSTARDEVQRELAQVTAERTGRAAGMQIGHDQALFMEMLTRAIGARRAIEIGTFTGYSSLAIARGLGPEGHLTCCDVSEEWTSTAREFWRRAGVEDRIDLRIAPALETIASFGAEVRFDLAFIDADKENYAAYLDALDPHLPAGAIVLIDNTLWSGAVLDPPSDDASAQALAALNDALVDGERFTVAMLTIGDGVTMLQKR
ncbi:MAG: class I SAM-dependent methyltransferase [Microthrixaceae bacterium]|nr:class I SAM-dependent methyltransferase [Microthrixaceae bacterium]MCO5314046.1 class I SAM-dependent methyltransferase [Microthrixaceae bacterium]